MATRTPKGPVAGTTPKKVVAKPTVVPPAEKITEAPVAPAPVAVETLTPVVAHAVEEVKTAPAEAAPTPVAAETPVAVAPEVPKAAAPKAAVKPAAPKEAKSAAPKAAPASAPTPEAVAAPAVPAAIEPAAPAAKDVVQAVAYTKEKVEKMSKQVFATFEDVVGFQKENVEAFVASSTILSKGFEALSKEIAAFTQAQYEQSVATTKALFAVKSVKELVDLQTEFAKSSFDAIVAEATKVSEAGIKVANEAAEPITARVNATVEKLSKLKAA
ncbi:MAG: phasin family protein [Niveispirillum sp.]|uniref:phasin family protein n=1 Tax=Niveispirillum sp. TaxID=1917217 RepID=UPI004035F1ED